ncbi:MAG: element excision factor XisH family protein [Bacteroidota bacterium]
MTKDAYHDIVVRALEKENWDITKEHYFLPIGKKKAYADIAAEKVIAATKGKDKILVEIKSFVGKSEMTDLQKALGQYGLYTVALEDKEPERKLFLAIPRETYEDLFMEPIIQKVLERQGINLLVFDIKKEEIVKWIKR